MPPAPLFVTDVLGEARPVHSTWPDGSYTCPWCGAAVTPAARELPCPNPMCAANPHADPREVQARRQRADEQRARLAELREREARLTEYARRDQERRQAEIEAAREAGYCVLCLVRSGYRRRVRHRRPDYHEHELA